MSMAPSPSPAQKPAVVPPQQRVRIRDRLRGLLIAARIWRRSRPHRVRAVLCALGFLALGALGLAAASQSRLELLVRYGRWAREAERAGRWDAAALDYRRCLALDPRNHGARLGLALALEHLGDEPRAAALMSELARGTTPSEPAARLWLVRRLLAAGASTGPEPLRAAEAHLERLAQLQPENAQVRETLARVYVGRGRVDRAVAEYRSLAATQPTAALSLAALQRGRGDAAAAGAAARQAAEAFERRLAREPRDLAARSGLATARVFLGDHDAAEGLLRAGLALSPDPALRQALANVLVAHEAALADDPATPLPDRLRRLSEAVALVPGHEAALTRLARLTAAGGAEAEPATAALKQALAQGEASAVVHLILGTQAFDRGALEEARVHLDQALALDPWMPAVANNLAWVLFQSDRAASDRALELVDRAIELDPRDPEYRATRGMIRAHRGEWRAAVSDLELALHGDSARADVHGALADAYEHLGDPDLAARHRALQAPAARP